MESAFDKNGDAGRKDGVFFKRKIQVRILDS
jgi:hypothetical protein